MLKINDLVVILKTASIYTKNSLFKEDDTERCLFKKENGCRRRLASRLPSHLSKLFIQYSFHTYLLKVFYVPGILTSILTMDMDHISQYPL